MVQGGKKRILLIDDDEFMKILFKDIFWIHGSKDAFDVCAVSRLEEAERLINDSNNRPDIVFLDLVLAQSKEKFSLENNESLNFLREIKNNEKTKDTIVIVFSGYGDKEVVKKALELGADKFLVKGEFLPKELIQLVESILSKK